MTQGKGRSFLVVGMLTLSMTPIFLASCEPAPSRSKDGATESRDIRVVSTEPVEKFVYSENFPLPNCDGTSELTQTLSATASILKGVTVGSTGSIMGGGEVSIPTTLQLKLEIEVEATYQRAYEAANARLDTINISAAANTSVVYKIGWYEQSYQSTIRYSDVGNVLEVPYTFTLRIPKIEDSFRVECPDPSSSSESPSTQQQNQATQAPPLVPAPDSLSETNPIGKCPASREEAASIFGGTPYYWTEFSSNAWKFGPAPGAPISNLLIPEGMKGDWWDDYKTYSRIGPAEVGYASEATIWCTP